MAEGELFFEVARRNSRAAELQQVKIREGKKFPSRKSRGARDCKKKKPGAAGLFDELLF
jgi:hypothetical protein